MSSNRNVTIFGQSVTFTARVTPVAATGTVTFTAGRRHRRRPPTLDSTGRATLVTSTLAVGSHTISAAYNGSTPNYLPSASTTVIQTVNKAGSRTAVTTSGSPAPRGTTVVFTSTVTPVAQGTGAFTGTVQFNIDGVNVGAPVIIDASGTATYATPTLAVGRHTVSAIYSGDVNHNASNSGTITQRIQ